MTVPVPTAVTAQVSRNLSIDTKIDELGSLRATPWDNVLIYGTGGLAWSHMTDNMTITQSTQLINTTTGALLGTPRLDTFSASSGYFALGWAAGAGIDFKFTPNWIIADA